PWPVEILDEPQHFALDHEGHAQRARAIEVTEMLARRSVLSGGLIGLAEPHRPAGGSHERFRTVRAPAQRRQKLTPHRVVGVEARTVHGQQLTSEALEQPADLAFRL